MIDSVETFSDRLNGLDPDDAAFVLHVDELVEQMSPATLEAAYPAIFRFFEAHPENDYLGESEGIQIVVDKESSQYIPEGVGVDWVAEGGQPDPGLPGVRRPCWSHPLPEDIGLLYGGLPPGF